MVQRKSRITLMLCCVLLWGYQFHAFGQQPASAVDLEACPNEHAKLNTEDATPVDPGYYELELAYSFARATRQWDDHWSGENRGLVQESAFEVGLTHGVLEDLDIGLGIGYADIYDRDYDADDTGGPHYGRGHTDLGVGAKWRFYRSEDGQLSLAYVPGLTIPIGRRSNRNHTGPSQEYWSLEQRLALSKDWRGGPAEGWRGWTMNADVGYSLPFGSRRNAARGTLDANLAVGYQVYEWLQPELELNYAHDFVSEGDDADMVAVTCGVIMPLSDHWRVQAGLQQAVAGRNTDRSTVAMLSLIRCW